jgi:hypothetical protein
LVKVRFYGVTKIESKKFTAKKLLKMTSLNALVARQSVSIKGHLLKWIPKLLCIVVQSEINECHGYVSLAGELNQKGRFNMKRSLIIILIPTIIFIVIAYVVGGSSLILNGLTISMNTAVRSALMLLVSFVLIGQIQVLITKEMLDRWLQKFSGIKGIIIGALAGGMFPGGPYIYFPFIQSFNKKGMPFYIFIAFIFGKNIYDFTRIPMEVSLINPNIALIRNLVTLPIPIIVGLLAKQFYKNRTVESIFLRAGETGASDDHNS